LWIFLSIIIIIRNIKRVNQDETKEMARHFKYFIFYLIFPLLVFCIGNATENYSDTIRDLIGILMFLLYVFIIYLHTKIPWLSKYRYPY
jgi:predicted permease